MTETPAMIARKIADQAYLDKMRELLENGHILSFETFDPECLELDDTSPEWAEIHGTVEITDTVGTRRITLIGCEGYHIHRDYLYRVETEKTP